MLEEGIGFPWVASVFWVWMVSFGLAAAVAVVVVWNLFVFLVWIWWCWCQQVDALIWQRISMDGGD